MKLTLRTLLAYLDDTLDPSAIKTIGEKVAESDNAQELVSRLRQVTRRRRLTTPPEAGPGAFDPNEVSEYLDNTLSAERVVELEKQCLESDVHLAEIATCHQILTLVLGEPALVPPKARERMYKLVAGRESIPYRKAAPARKPASGIAESEEDLLPGDNWLRWVLPAAGVLLVLVLGFAAWQLTRSPGTRPPVVADTPRKDSDDKEKKEAGKDAAPKDGDKKDAGKDGSPKDNGKKGPDKDAGKDGPPKDNGKKGPDKDGAKDGGKDGGKEVPRIQPPSPDRVVAGRYTGVGEASVAGLPTALAVKGGDGWVCLDQDGRVHTSDVLVTPPGLVSQVESGGCLVTMRGNVPAYSLVPFMNFLLESSIVLHKPDGFDIDLTLRRGRIYLKNVKAREDDDRLKATPVKARVRFEKEVWDITLPQKNDEVGLELIRLYPPDLEVNFKAGDEPRSTLILCVLAGEAEVKVDAYQKHTLEKDEKGGTMMMLWDSFSRASPPQRIPLTPPGWSKRPPAPEVIESDRQRADVREFGVKLASLAQALKGGRKPAVAFAEMLSKDDMPSRALAVYGYGSIEDIDALVGILGDDDKSRAPVRATAIFVLRHWLAQDPGNHRKLYDAKDDTGVLRKRGLTRSQAESALTLLFDFPPKDRYTTSTFETLARLLGHNKSILAELAFWNLARLSIPVRLPDGFNAGSSPEERHKYSALIEDLIRQGKLPPPPPMSEKGP
jgi:hypothetical protein